ncbi:uncharacterized protein [Hemitrygon akajei]|uniref:uncharacterized protein n=1 Tax=Hemitrygon akajei TaxID=2704970 RepID=UPI003BF9A930
MVPATESNFLQIIHETTPFTSLASVYFKRGSAAVGAYDLHLGGMFSSLLSNLGFAVFKEFDELSSIEAKKPGEAMIDSISRRLKRQGRLKSSRVIHMKCFERLVMRHIKTLLPPSLDPLQFAYHPNRSTDDAIATTLHLALTHLDKKDTYVRMLFIDFSSAFNTIIPQKLIGKLSLLGLNTSLCNWILDFLSGRPQSVWIGSSISNTITLNTGVPPGLRAQTTAVHSADPRLCCSTQLEPNHQFCR